MDDDDLYDADHVWDLVLAHDYSRASLVGKAAEYVYLATSNRTVRRFSRGAETYRNSIAGGAMLIARSEIDRVGGWQSIPRSVDQALIKDVIRAGGRVYRTHGCAKDFCHLHGFRQGDSLHITGSKAGTRTEGAGSGAHRDRYEHGVDTVGSRAIM